MEDSKTPVETFSGKDVGDFLQDQVFFSLPGELLALCRKRQKKIFLCRHFTLPAEGWLDGTGKPPREKAPNANWPNNTQNETFVKPEILPAKIFLVPLLLNNKKYLGKL